MADIVEESQEASQERLAYVEDEATGRFYALLPCGKRPVIQPVHPRLWRRVYEDKGPPPEPPDKLVEVKGTGMAQRLGKDRKDPEFLEAYANWYGEWQYAMLTRAVINGLVVPEDADYDGDDGPRIAMPDCPLHREFGSMERWRRMGLNGSLDDEPAEKCTCLAPEEDWSATLRDMRIDVPTSGADRQWAYAEEALPEILSAGLDQFAFVEAVRQVSTPTEERIRRARRGFRDALAREIAGRPGVQEGRGNDDA